jgi:hypothetical protein
MMPIGVRFWPEILTAGLAFGPSLPLVLYTSLAFRSDPILAQWQRQNLILSPNPVHYLAAWGLWFAPAAIGVIVWLRAGWRKRPSLLFLVVWLAVVPFLLYAPYNLQRRFAEGAQLPLVCLAVWALTAGLARAGRRPLRRAATISVTVLSLLSTPLILAGGAGVAANRAQPVYLPRDEIEAFRWVGLNAPPGAAVLSSFRVGNALPAYAPVRVYLGHGPETAFADRKQEEVEAFFSAGGDDDFRRSLLRRAEIEYVIQPASDLPANQFDLATAPYLRLQASFGEYTIYRVIGEGGA